jgi:hypothetical protein
MSADTFYTTHAWRLISRHVRFGRALGYCEICGVPHGAIAADGRSFILLNCAHLNGNVHDLRPKNLAAFCSQCHFLYDQIRRVRALARKHPELREFLAGGGGTADEGSGRRGEGGKRKRINTEDTETARAKDEG